MVQSLHFQLMELLSFKVPFTANNSSNDLPCLFFLTRVTCAGVTGSNWLPFYYDRSSCKKTLTVGKNNGIIENSMCDNLSTGGGLSASWFWQTFLD